MKADEIREWDETEIQARLKELQEERFRLKFRTATMELEINEERAPQTDGTAGLRVLSVLEAVNESLTSGSAVKPRIEMEEFVA